MVSSGRHTNRPRIRSEISRDLSSYEETAARTRPFSFDEIIARRRHKQKIGEDEGAVESTSGVEEVSDLLRSGRNDGHNRDVFTGGEEHGSEKEKVGQQENQKVPDRLRSNRNNGRNRDALEEREKEKVGKRENQKVSDCFRSDMNIGRGGDANIGVEERALEDQEKKNVGKKEIQNVSDRFRPSRNDGLGRDASTGVEERVLEKLEKEKVRKKENEKVSDRFRTDRNNGHNRDATSSVEERVSAELEKEKVRKKENEKVSDRVRSARNSGRNRDAFTGVEECAEEREKEKVRKKEGKKVSDRLRSDRNDGHNRDAFTGVEKHALEEHQKEKFRKKENDSSSNVKDRGVRETKLKVKDGKDLRAAEKGKIDGKYHDKRKHDELQSNEVQNEASKKQSRDFVGKDRDVARSEKSDRENKRIHQNGAEEKNRDQNTSKRHDVEKRHHTRPLERKEMKTLSKSHNEETVWKRRRSRIAERGNRSRLSVSPSLRGNHHESYHRREHVEMSSHKERSERQHNDKNRSKFIDDDLRGHHRRPSGTSGLGGYSPRKRKTEAADKSPSPVKQLKEKRSSKKWDIAPEGIAGSFSTPISYNSQPSNQLATLNAPKMIVSVPTAPTVVNSMSAVPSSALYANRSATIDSVQLTQATRPLRRLYVDNVPASASEKELMEYLNNLLVSSGVNHIRGTQPCISCIVHKEKGQALVEFLTPEDASAALSFDGSNLSGSILKIRRPKDFVEVTGVFIGCVIIDVLAGDEAVS